MSEPPRWLRNVRPIGPRVCRLQIHELRAMLYRLLWAWLTPPTDLEARMTIIAHQDEDREQHRAELKEALHHLCDGAKNLRRKGYIGTASTAYAKQHARIDALLTELEAS